MFGIGGAGQRRKPTGQVLISPGSRFASNPPAFDPCADQNPVLDTGGLLGLWQKTIGTLSLDIKRPIVPKDAERLSLFRVRRPRSPRIIGHTPLGTPVLSHPGQSPSTHGLSTSGSLIAFPDVEFSTSGARLKVLRHIRFGPASLTQGGETSWPGGKSLPCLDFGLGGQLNFDTAAVQPKARLKFQDWLSLRLLPVPSIKLQKRFPLHGYSAGIKVSYECPLEDLRSCWQPPAKLLVSIDSCGAQGLRLTQGGLEFDQRVTIPGGRAVIRAAGRVELPAQLPLEEGEPFARATLHRAGIKALW